MFENVLLCPYRFLCLIFFLKVSGLSVHLAKHLVLLQIGSSKWILRSGSIIPVSLTYTFELFHFKNIFNLISCLRGLMHFLTKL